jgi:pimeloyl-ACP methyl ester carboxylesterase
MTSANDLTDTTDDATTERTATVRAATLWFEQSGEGPDLIWGHGLSQSREAEATMGLIDWTRVPARVLRYDARGHGRSDSTPELEGYAWSELARDQLALADHCGIDRYIVAGASMGCGTALHVAVLAPERVRGLVLVIPPTAWETRAGQAGLWRDAARAIEEHGVDAFIEARAAIPPPDPLSGDETYRDRAAAATRLWEPARLARVLAGAAGADFPTRDEIATIGAPTLILAWTGDAVHPESTADALHSLIPHADLSIASTLEDLVAWSDRLGAFVTGLG